MQKIAVYRAILVGCFLAALLLFPAVLFWDVSAQTGTTPVPTPATTLPEIAATQQAQIDDLTRQVKAVNQRSNSLRFAEIEQKLNEKLWVIVGIAAGISAIAAFFSWKTYSTVKETVAEQVQQGIDAYWKTDGKKLMEERIYGFDPSRLRIWLRSGRNLKRVADMLELTGLREPEFYHVLNERCLEGVVIVPMQSAEDEEEFRAFLEQYEESLNTKKVAFILFAVNYHVTQQTLDCYPNTTLANMPITVTNAVLVVGRGLRPRPDPA